MKKKEIFAGQIVNTHGIKGDIKLHPAAVDLTILAKLKTIYIDGNPVKVIKGTVQKQMILYHLEKIDDMDAALALKGKNVYFQRIDANLPKGVFFDEELEHLQVLDVESKENLGQVSQVLSYPAQKILEVVGEKTYLIPWVQQVFIDHVDLDEEIIYIHNMRGLAVDED